MLRNSKFFSIFPPPALLNVRCAGMHISDEAIRVIVLSQKNTVINFGEALLPKGLIDNGSITNENSLAQIIKGLKEKLKLSQVRVSLPEERMYLFNIETAGVSDLGIKDIVESKLEENIPVPPPEVVYEFDPFERKNRLITKVNVSAFTEKMIQSYLSCCTLAGLDVQGFDTEPRAIIKSIIPGNEVCLVIDISLNHISMFVASEKVAQFSSTIDFNDQTKTDILLSEIKKVNEYWNTHAEGRDIKKIYIIGEAASDETLIDKIGANIDLPVVLGDVWAGILNKDNVPPIEFAKALNYSVAIGLAIKK